MAGTIQNAKFAEIAHPVLVIPPINNPGSNQSGTWVSMKHYNRCCFMVMCANDSTGAASTVTVNQAKTSTGTGSKAVTFLSTAVDYDIDTATLDTLNSAAATTTSVTITSGSFVTSATASKNQLFLIEVRAMDLDLTFSLEFSWVQLVVTTNIHSNIAAVAVMREPRYAESPDAMKGVLS